MSSRARRGISRETPHWVRGDTLMDLSEKILRILTRLAKAYPDAKVALSHSNPLELLIATLLSAQSTDKQINKLTPALFARYKTAEDFAHADIKELEDYVRSSGFFHNKAKNIRLCCRALLERHGGEVPRTMEELVLLPGVGRKTANVILSNAYGKNVGVCVDTHVARLSQRLGFSKHKDPVKIERDLMELAPRKDWRRVTDLLIRHGRETCFARRPACERCPVREMCTYYALNNS